MRIRLAWLLGLVGLLAAGNLAPAAGPPVARKPSTPAQMQALAVKIDRLIARCRGNIENQIAGSELRSRRADRLCSRHSRQREDQEYSPEHHSSVYAQ